MLFSALHAALCALLVIVYLLLIYPIVIYFRDPLRLRKYPSPTLLASLTPLWLIKATWNQTRSRDLHQQFLRLGDVIRVSPNQIIFNDPAAIKDIYGVLALSRGVAKDEFYDRLAGDAHDLVQIRNRGEHANRRKALANAFAAKTVVNMEPIIRRTLAQLFRIIDKHIAEQPSGEQQPLNLRQWLNFFTLDVIGDTGFGMPMGFLENINDSAVAESQTGTKYRVAETINTLHKGVRYSLTLSNITSIRLIQALKSIVAFFPPLARGLGATCAENFENICIEKLRSRIRKGVSDRECSDFMEFMLRDKGSVNESTGDVEAKTFSQAQFRVLVADSVMMMNAGSDTTAAALTSTVWFLLNNPKALTRLREELTPMWESHGVHLSVEESMYKYEQVKDLPFLRACIDESLRLRPPIAYQLPRLVSKPVTIAGHELLPGTVVAVAPYSVHRHPSLYRAPDEYRPERWVDFDEGFPEQREDLKKYNIVFSQGSRACIGRHLAIIELQVLIPSLLMRYDLELTDNSAKQLKVSERFNSNPGPMHVFILRRDISRT